MRLKVGQVPLEAHDERPLRIRECRYRPDVVDTRHPRSMITFVVLRSERFKTEITTVEHCRDHELWWYEVV
jgi:hypothetical protein